MRVNDTSPHIEVEFDSTACCCAHPIVLKELQDEGDGAGVDANEEVDAGQRHVGSARDVEYVGHWIHHGRHRPPVETHI